MTIITAAKDPPLRPDFLSKRNEWVNVSNMMFVKEEPNSQFSLKTRGKCRS